MVCPYLYSTSAAAQRSSIAINGDWVLRGMSLCVLSEILIALSEGARSLLHAWLLTYKQTSVAPYSVGFWDISSSVHGLAGRWECYFDLFMCRGKPSPC